MTSHRSKAIEAAALAALASLYLALCLPDLATLPPVYEDEPWQASTAWKLAAEGTFGSDLFAGLDGMERSCFRYPPVHPLLLAATFRLCGIGLLQARSLTVGMGLVALLLTWALGRRLGGPWLGGLAALLLILVRTTYVDRYQGSGILFLDTIRIARYDAVVPAFALLATLVASRAAERHRPRLWALAGFLLALAALTHLYGLLLVVPLAAFALWERAGSRALLAFAAGFLLPWLGYSAYVATDLAAWTAQTRWYGERFQLLDPAWYLDNLARERWRYAQGFGPAGWSWLARPGFWTASFGIPISLAILIPKAFRAEPGEPAPGSAVSRRHSARLLVLPVLLLPPLYALLLWLKLPSYRTMIQPFCALVLAWGLVTLWNAGERHQPRRLVLRAALLLLAALVTLEAGEQLVARERRARATTPYRELAARLRGALPPHGRILALHHYAFGFEARDFRSWVVPLLNAGAGVGAFAPANLTRELDALAPAGVVVDPRLRELFEHQPAIADVVFGWLEARGYRHATSLRDATYGDLDIWIEPAATPR